MKQVSDLITQARTLARNVANQDGTYSITDEEIVQYLNDGQDRMQNLLNSAKNIAKPFVTQAIIPLVASQEGYTIPDRVLLNKAVEYVEFSATGSVTDYIRLRKLEQFNRDTNTTAYPGGYYKRGNQIMLAAVPDLSAGSLRVSYERELEDLAPRLGTVLTATDVQIVIGSVIAALVPTTNDYLCIVSAYNGDRLALNIPVGTYAPGIITGVGFSAYLATGHTLADLIGGYVTKGIYSSAVSQLPISCERYLIHYAAAEMFRKDSSKDYTNAATLVGNIEKDIIEAFSSQTGEVQIIPEMSRYEW